MPLLEVEFLSCVQVWDSPSRIIYCILYNVYIGKFLEETGTQLVV